MFRYAESFVTKQEVLEREPLPQLIPAYEPATSVNGARRTKTFRRLVLFAERGPQ